MQLSDDCFAHGGGLLPLDKALELIRTRLDAVTEVETVALAAAGGRILAADIVATLDVPPHDNSAVDGYAVRFADLKPDGDTRLPVGGRAVAGAGLGREARGGKAIRIFTGAPMPAGLDTVAMQEDCRADGDTVSLPTGLRLGANRRCRGEDIRAGDKVLAAGRRLRAEDLGVAASVGQRTLAVRRQLRVGLCSTGDEVHEPGADRAADGIFDANRYALMGALRDLGCAVEDLGILPDRAEAVRGCLAQADRFDLLLTSGGASVGEEDHVAAALGELGAVHFWKLAIKPGRPMMMGQVCNTPVVGLPGNPAAVMVTFMMVARRLILRLAGAADEAPVAHPVRADFAHRKKGGRREFVRARLTTGPNGMSNAVKYPQEGAGNLMSFVASEGLVVLPEDTVAVAPGDSVGFIPFATLR